MERHSSPQNLNLGEAARYFLASLSPEQAKVSQQEVYKFNRWFGRERLFNSIKPSEIDNYAEQASRGDAGHADKLALVRAFLSYAKKKGWSEINLGTHLKAKKGKIRSAPTGRIEVIEPISVTREGYEKIQAELVSLKDQRQEAIEEMTKAAADTEAPTPLCCKTCLTQPERISTNAPPITALARGQSSPVLPATMRWSKSAPYG